MAEPSADKARDSSEQRAADELLVRSALTRRSENAAGATDVGRVRRRNEDAYWIDQSGRAALVADGLGGLPDGDVASREAVVAAAEFLRARLDEAVPPATAADPAEDLPPGRSPVHRLGTMLGDAFEAAHARVLAQPRRIAGALSMATALIGIAIEGDVAVLVHVGDVRGYVWRGGQIVLMTADHSRVGEMARSGLLSAEEARHHPERNIVTEVLGLPEGYRADIDAIVLEHGDNVVLCSDGLWEAVEEEAMGRLLEHAASASEAATWLIHAANAAGGRDNITVAVVRHGRAQAAPS